MTHVTAALLDLANLVGGFLLAAALLADLPRIGAGIARAAAAIAPARVPIGVLGLVMGGYYLLQHMTSGPHVFHFELVGIGIGIALLRDRLFPGTGSRSPDDAGADDAGADDAGAAAAGAGSVTGTALVLAVFGLIAMVVGVQGLLTPDG